MFDWIIGNIWTIIICAVLIGVVAAIIFSMVKKKKQGNPWYVIAATVRAALCKAPVINTKL